MSNLYEVEKQLMHEVENEKGFSWNKLVNLYKISAICKEME